MQTSFVGLQIGSVAVAIVVVVAAVETEGAVVDAYTLLVAVADA